MSVVLHSVVKGVYRPLHRTALFKALPSREYLYSLSSFSFRRNYNIVFDHLVAPDAFYLRREEFESWFQRGKLREAEQLATASVSVMRRIDQQWGAARGLLGLGDLARFRGHPGEAHS